MSHSMAESQWKPGPGMAPMVGTHVLDQVGVVKVLVLEALGGQLGIGLPAVGVGLDHPVVADVGVDDDLVLEVQAQPAGELAHGPVGHAAVVHGAVVGLPGDLHDAVLTLQVGEVLEPLFILVKLGQLDVISHRLSHGIFLLNTRPCVEKLTCCCRRRARGGRASRAAWGRRG